MNLFHTQRVLEGQQAFNEAAQALANVSEQVGLLAPTSQAAVEPLMREADGRLEQLGALLQLHEKNPNTPDEEWDIYYRVCGVARDTWNNAAQVAREQGLLEEMVAWLRAGQDAIKELAPDTSWIPWVLGGGVLLYAFLKGRQ